METSNKNPKIEIKAAISITITFAILSTIAFAIPNSLTLQGKLTNLAGVSQTGTNNFTFRIYDSAANGNALWELANYNVTTDANGVYDVTLSGINLSFADTYYLGITVGSDNESAPRINLTSSPYSFRSNISEGLNPNASYFVTNLSVNGNATIGTGATTLEVITQSFNLTKIGSISLASNITLGDKITFRLGQFIDNLVNGWLKVNGALNVSNGLYVGGGLNVSNDLRVNNLLNITSSGNLYTSGSINSSRTIQANTLTDGNATINNGIVSAAQVQVGGGFSSGGLTLTNNGDIITQGDVLFSGNITIVNVTILSVNGSVMPSLDNQFDVGNGTFRWRNANFSGALWANSIDGDTSLLKVGNISSFPFTNYRAGNATNDIQNGTILRNNSNAVFVNLSVTSLILGWTNLTGFPNACASGQFVTTVGNTLTCATPSPASGGGWTDDGAIVRLTTLTDNVAIGSNFTGEKLTVNGSFKVENGSSVPIFFVNATTQMVGIGTTLPNDALEIIGNVRISGSLNATSINATSIIVNGGIVQKEADAFKISNGSALPFSNFRLENVSNYSQFVKGIDFNINNISNTTKIANILDNNVLARVGDFNLGNISNYTQFIKGTDFNLGNVSNNTVEPFNKSISLWNISNNFIYPKYSELIVRIGNISSNVTNYINDTFTVFGSASVYGSLNATSINATTITATSIPLSIKSGDFDLRNISNYSQFVKGSDFNLGNVSNYTQFVKSSDFNLGNISNTTKVSNILDNNLLARVGDFNLGNISNYTQYVKSSDFNLGNVSNNTLVKGDNTSIALWNVSGSNIFPRGISGNVGIGTTSPGATLDVAGGIKLANDTTSCTSSKEGTMRWNGTTFSLCDGNAWRRIWISLTATGGTITTSGGYTLHTFTSSGTFTPSGSGNVEVLVVAGGGGGASSNSAGGGGGGGLIYTASLAVTAQAYTVTVGAGGAAGGGTGTSGGNSVFGSITATGGGGGANYLNAGVSGGSGGGGGSGTGGAGTSGQGNNGGAGSGGSSNGDGGGGGGGAGAVGADGTISVGGKGGDGTAYSISGTSTNYSGGGGGGRFNGGAGAGGSGGGGAGGTSGSSTAGTANTGGGGGGSGSTAAAGGSGIVIIRYPY